MNSENIIPLSTKDRQYDASQAKTRGEYGNVIRECRKTINLHLEKLIKSMFDNVDDFLFDLAEKVAHDSKQQANYFDAMRIIRVRRDEIEKSYMYRVDAQINLGLTAHLSEKKTKVPSAGSNDFTTFNLLDNTDLEESLAITNMTAKISSKLNRELFALAQRFNFIFATQHFTAQEQPLSVDMFCNAFKDALSVLGDDAIIEIKLIIYKIFERYVLVGFAQLYFDVNNIFIKAGIVPTIKNSIIKPQGSLSNKRVEVADFLDDTVDLSYVPSTDPSRGGFAVGYDAAYEATSGDVYQHLRQLLAHTYHTAPIGSDEIVANGHETQKLVEILTSLQQRAAVPSVNTTSIHSATQIKNSLIDVLSVNQDGSMAKPLHDDYNDTIDIIALLFEFILDDDNLHPAMKALLARLQIPVLKIAMLDKQFFSHNSHPARRLLNEMARVCVGWAGSDELDNDILYQGVLRIVQRVLAEFNDNTELFSELLAQFQTLCEQWTEKESQAQEYIVEAKQEAMAVIEATTKDKEMPEEIRKFFNTHWFEVLTKIHEQSGKESEEWRSAMDVMDNLLWSILPKTDEIERRLLLVMIPQLLDSIDAGMAKVQAHPDEIKNLKLILENYHLKSMRPLPKVNKKTIASTHEDKGDFPTNDTSEEIILESSEAGHNELREALASVNAMVLGTWVEFNLADGSVARGKLVWKDDYFDSYTFVNRRFKVVVDDCKAEIARLLQENRARIIEHVPLFDRALDAIAEKLAKLSASKVADECDA